MTCCILSCPRPGAVRAGSGRRTLVQPAVSGAIAAYTRWTACCSARAHGWSSRPPSPCSSRCSPARPHPRTRRRRRSGARRRCPTARRRSASTSQLGIDTLQLIVQLGRRRAAAPRRADRSRRPGLPLAGRGRRRRGRGGTPRHPPRACSSTARPPWANGGRAPIWRPDRAQDFADFLTAAARRYPAVRRWMIWGEPNRADRFQPNARNSAIGPRAYATLLDAAYAALKRASATTSSSARTPGRAAPSSRRTSCAGCASPTAAPPRLDWLGHNPFPFRFPKLAERPLAGGYRDISDLDTISRDVRARVPPRRPAVAVGVHDPVRSRLGRLRDVRLARRAGALPHRRLTRSPTSSGPPSPASAGSGCSTSRPRRGSANLGLMTYAGQRKPAFAALLRAPERAPAPARHARRRRSAAPRCAAAASRSRSRRTRPARSSSNCAAAPSCAAAAASPAAPDGRATAHLRSPAAAPGRYVVRCARRGRRRCAVPCACGRRRSPRDV